MLYIKKPRPIHAYIFGEDDEVLGYVRGSEDGFFVRNIHGVVIRVIKGDYIIPESTESLVDPRAMALNPKVFRKHYKKVEYSDAEVIKDEE